MTAGAGAQEQARRWAERLERERAALVEQQRRTAEVESRLRGWEAGAQGERLVAAELDRLASRGWTLLHDVHWPGRPRANLDHVAVGPAGVLVIDAKNWSGHVVVRDGVLRNGTYRKTSDCEAVARMVAAVAAQLDPGHRAHVQGAICLVQHDQGAVTAEAGTVVVGLGALLAWIEERPAVLAAADVTTVLARLQPSLSGTTPSRGRGRPTALNPTAARGHQRPETRGRSPRPASPSPASSSGVSARRTSRRAPVRLAVLLLLLLALVGAVRSCEASLAAAIAREDTTRSVQTTPAVPTTTPTPMSASSSPPPAVASPVRS